jgi:hypothetical protein
MLYVYGEDAMTLYALTTGLQTFLKHPTIQRDGQPKQNECEVFYRPSFGRKGGPGRAEFGEFDAIIASKTRIYLIESKWPRTNISKLKLEPRQKLRHDIFRWLYKSWNEWKTKHKNEWNEILKNGTIWDKFHEATEDKYQKRFKEDTKILPKPGSALATNLQFVLEHLPAKLKIIDILLLFHEGNNKLTKVDWPRGKFRLIDFDFSIDNIFEEKSKSKIFKLKT